MKKLIPALFVALPIAAMAIDVPLEFPNAKILMPPLSLEESALQGAPSLVNDFHPVEKVTVVWKMPIVVPAADLDPKMVKAPDSSVEFKLTIRNPEVEPAQQR